MFEDLASEVAAAVADQPHDVQLIDDVLPGASGAAARIVTRLAGTSFEAGLYRMLKLDEVGLWISRCERLVPEARGRATCFATDWLGRAWGFYRDDDRVFVVEPYAGTLLSAPFTVETFHSEELVENGAEVMEAALWREWTAASKAPGPAECVGLKVPQFLGGELAAPNLVLSDTEVYWELCAQLLDQTRDLPAGSSLAGIRTTDR